MKNTKAILSIGVFALLLALPNAVFPAVSGFIDTENHEKRAYAEFPDFSPDDPESFFAGLEAYYNDRVPFKNQFKKLHSGIDAFLSGFESPFTLYMSASTVTRGKDGWLFYTARNKDEFSTEDYAGTNLYTEEELAEMALRYETVRDALSDQGVEVVYFFAPGKEQIYDNYMPDRFPAHADDHRTYQLTRYLKEHTDLHVVYPYEELRALRDSRPLYYRYDSHWNDQGAFVGFQAVMQELTGSRLTLDEVSFSSKPTENMYDLAEVLGITDDCQDDLDYSISAYPKDVTMGPLEWDKVHEYDRRKSDAKDERRVLLLHDSFGLLWRGQVNLEFSDVTFVTAPLDARRVIEEEKPDILIIEIAERYAVRQETWPSAIVYLELPPLTLSDMEQEQ